MRVYAAPLQRVDLLIWIDDSASMREEQPTVTSRLGPLVLALLEPPDRDGDTRPDGPPVEDLNVGIVAPEMPSTDALPWCSAIGSARVGCLLREPPVPGAGCEAMVASICGSDWLDAVRGITDRLAERFLSLCLPRELPVDDGACTPECAVVETLSDDRPCPEDPACPAARCPPATAGEALDPPHCVDPFTGGECRPYKRDLGLVRVGDDAWRRQCLVRAARRRWDAATGTCGWPENAGWFYIPPERGPDACAELRFHDPLDGGAGPEPGSQAELRCGWTTCRDGDGGDP